MGYRSGRDFGGTARLGGYLAALAGLVCLVMLVAFRNFSEAAQRANPERLLTFLPAQLLVCVVVRCWTRSPRAWSVTRESRAARLSWPVYTVLEWL